MTKTLLGIALWFATAPSASFAATTATATTGQYVCQEAAIDPADIAATLNSMGCNSTLPFTVNYVPNGALAIVCCVSQ